MIFPVSIGVSIESDRVALILLKSMVRTVQVVDARIHPLSPENSVNDQIDLINGLLCEFIRENRVSGVNVFVAIPRHLTLFRLIELPVAVKENFGETLDYEIEKYIPFSANDICYDAEIVSEDKKAGTIEILLVAAKKERLEPYYRLARDIDASLAGIDITSNAIVNFFAAKQILEYPITGIVYGGSEIIEIDGVKNRVLIHSKWRNIKNTSLAEFILNEMDLLREKPPQEYSEKGQMQLVLCLEQPNEQLVEKLNDADRFSVLPLDISETDIAEMGLLPAYGLALKGLQRVPMDINLLPAEHQKKPNKMAYYVLYGLSALLLICLLVWVGGHIAHQRIVYERLNEQIDLVKTQVAETKGCQDVNQQIRDNLDYLNSYTTRYGWLIDILNELSQSIPSNAWVYRFDFSDGKVQIEGLADNASGLIPLLENSPLFNDASFLTTITKGRNGKENFTIGLDVKKNPDI